MEEIFKDTAVPNLWAIKHLKELGYDYDGDVVVVIDIPGYVTTVATFDELILKPCLKDASERKLKLTGILGFSSGNTIVTDDSKRRKVIYQAKKL